MKMSDDDAMSLLWLLLQMLLKVQYKTRIGPGLATKCEPVFLQTILPKSHETLMLVCLQKDAKQ